MQHSRALLTIGKALGYKPGPRGVLQSESVAPQVLGAHQQCSHRLWKSTVKTLQVSGNSFTGHVPSCLSRFGLLPRTMPRPLVLLATRDFVELPFNLAQVSQQQLWELRFQDCNN